MVEENMWENSPGEIGLTDELVSVVTLKTLTFKLVLHFAHFFI